MGMTYGKPAIARGGDRGYKFVDENGNIYGVHVFKSSSVFTCYYNNLNIDCLIVGGGGYGGVGNSPAGGGGAGGLVFVENMSVSNTNHTIVIGGAAGNSTAFNYTALAGGNGGSGTGSGSNGGSGGGASNTSYNSLPGSGLQPTETPGVGYGTNGSSSATGGGGGAGGNTSDRNGGVGKYYGDKFGTNYGENGYFAGGGGGINFGAGGVGGGGRAGSWGFGTDYSNYNNKPVPTIINTGGGGGAIHYIDNLNFPETRSRRNGASGIVIIRYQI